VIVIVAETDAKTMACCAGPARPADNGPCIGAACMAWCWAVEDLPPEPDTIVRSVFGGGLPGAPRFEKSKTHGYCGMTRKS
jgi:hypothetical protein